MELSKIKSKQRIFGIINIILVVSIILLSVLTIILAWDAEDKLVSTLFAWISLVFGFISFTVGVLLPAKEKKVFISEDSMEKLVTANLILNNNVSSLSYAKGQYLFRTWHYAGALVNGTLMMLINCIGLFVCVGENLTLAFTTYTATAVLWFIFIVVCAVWTYYEDLIDEIKEYGVAAPDHGKKSIRKMGIITLAVFIIFGSGAIYAVIDSNSQKSSFPDFNPDEVNQKLAEIQDNLNSLSSEDLLAPEEYENIEEALAYIKTSHNNSKFYYILQYASESTLNIISWDDESDDVFIDSFEILENDRLKRGDAYISSSMTKEDVSGKETGYIE